MDEAGEKITVHIDAELEPIVPRFLEIRKEDIEMIDEALEKNDFDTIRRLGHTMKGAGASYGFDEVSVIGETMEGAALNCDAEKIKKSVSELTSYLERVEVIYDE